MKPYAHVAGLDEIPYALIQRQSTMVKPDLPWEPRRTASLHLLSLAAQGTILPLDPECAL